MGSIPIRLVGLRFGERVGSAVCAQPHMLGVRFPAYGLTSVALAEVPGSIPGHRLVVGCIYGYEALLEWALNSKSSC